MSDDNDSSVCGPDSSDLGDASSALRALTNPAGYIGELMLPEGTTAAFADIESRWKSLESWAGGLPQLRAKIPENRLQIDSWEAFSGAWYSGNHNTEGLIGQGIDVQAAQNGAALKGYKAPSGSTSTVGQMPVPISPSTPGAVVPALVGVPAKVPEIGAQTITQIGAAAGAAAGKAAAETAKDAGKLTWGSIPIGYKVLGGVTIAGLAGLAVHNATRRR